MAPTSSHSSLNFALHHWWVFGIVCIFTAQACVYTEGFFVVVVSYYSLWNARILKCLNSFGMETVSGKEAVWSLPYFLERGYLAKSEAHWLARPAGHWSTVSLLFQFLPGCGYSHALPRPTINESVGDLSSDTHAHVRGTLWAEPSSQFHHSWFYLFV